MTRFTRPAAALILALSFAGESARAVDLSVFGGLNYAAPTQRLSGGDLHWTGDAGFSYGVTAALPLFETPFEVESGLFLLQENSSDDSSGSGSASSRKNRMLQVPLVLRYNLDEHIGLGVGGYLAFGQGQVESTTNNVTTSTTYALAGEKNNDAGLIVNVRARFNLAPPFFFLLDGRYQHGLTNRALAPADLYNTRSVQAFAGFQWMLLPSPDRLER